MSEAKPNQVERIEAARSRAASDPLYALRIFRAIYARLPEREKRQRRHLGHDGRGFKELHQHEMCVLYESLERRNWKLMEHEEEMLCREMPQYAGQYVRHQYAVERALREEVEATKQAIHDHASVEEEEQASRKERQQRVLDAAKAKREAHPFWGAAMRNPAILDNLPD